MEKDGQEKLLRELYPGLSEDELREVANRLDEYLELTLRIYERITGDPTAHALLRELLAEQRKPEDKPADTT